MDAVVSRPLRFSPQFLTSLAVLLALLHAVLAVTATAEKSMTSDEIAHLTAGQAYNMRDDYRLQPENGNLPQRLGALPMTIAQVALPPASLLSWRIADVWAYGHVYFYERGLPADWWVLLGRSMIALVSAATGLLVFIWSRALFGWRGGFLSLGLFAFSPTLLAHGALATSDAVMAFFFLAAVGAWWRHLERPGPKWAAISMVTVGLAFVAKFSAAVLPVMLVLIGTVWAIGEARRRGARAPILRLGRSTIAHVGAAWLIIWAFYGFRYSAFAPSVAEGARFLFNWDSLLVGIGFPAKVIRWFAGWHAFPSAYLYGLSHVLQLGRARGAFMSGEYGIYGWVGFFPWAFTIKTTLPLLILCFVGLLAAARELRRQHATRSIEVLARLRPLLPLAVLFVVYWGWSLTSHLNIGHRHILPTYPVLFIAVGWLGRRLDPRWPAAFACIASLTLWHVGESLWIRPHYLAYFNEIIGGPRNGWRHLVDSSLDWGQDLPGLKRWLVTNAPRERVFLSYFGTGEPAYEGIPATAMPMLPSFGLPHPAYKLEPGIYAISATMLQNVYSNFRGDWTPAFEKEFEDLRAIESALIAYQNDPAQRPALVQDVPAEKWDAGWKRYEGLRFARLCHYLRARGADATIGYSILVFRLDAAEIAGATGGSIQQWRAAIERAATKRPATGR